MVIIMSNKMNNCGWKDQKYTATSFLIYLHTQYIYMLQIKL